MRRLVGVAALVLSLGCAEAPADACEVLEAAAVVELALDTAPQCLGVQLAPGWVLTAQHCVQPLGEAALAPTRLTVAGARVDRMVLRGEAAHSIGDLIGSDLALLHVQGLDRPLAALGSPSTSSTCAVVRRAARPLSAPTQATEGANLYADAETRPGDSGGPLMDLRGRTLGIASWRAGPDGPAVYTRIDAHEEWLWAVIDG